jgi:hypothetical protein
MGISNCRLTLEPHTGNLIWKREWADIASCSQDKVFFSEVPRHSISAADLATGQTIWIGTKPYKGSLIAVIYNPETDEVIASPGGPFYVIDPESGQIKHDILRERYLYEGCA